jgi:hypothetical protein
MTTFTVTNEADLLDALTRINPNDGAPNAGVARDGAADVINITADITLSGVLPALNLSDALTINGGGFRIDGAAAVRGLVAWAGDVTINNLTFFRLAASGGDGGRGGGGGAGLGGGLFVHTGASVTLDTVTFDGNRAVGGAGSTFISNGGGGGGGMGGAGQASFNGGGGGFGTGAYTASQAGVVVGGASGGAGAVAGGAAGGVGGAGASAVSSGGGGGVGGGAGGGAGVSFTGGAGGFGGGAGGGSNGGAGGFGGGGGAGSGAADGGAGGFGGGGGSGAVGGEFGGSGVGGVGGGGGAGLGGAIFVQQGGSLTIRQATLLNNQTVSGGVGGGTAASGQAQGAGVFIQGAQDLTFAPTVGQTASVSAQIADQNAGGNRGRLVMDGAGTLSLLTANTFSGGIALNDGTLALGEVGAAGTGEIAFGTGAQVLRLANAVTAPGETFDTSLRGFATVDTVDVQGIGLATGAAMGANNVLTLIGGTRTVTLNFDDTENFAGFSFSLTSDGGGGTVVRLVAPAGATAPPVVSPNDDLILTPGFGGQGGGATLAAGDGADIVRGTESNDSINGNRDNDSVRGNGGADSLYGGKGADILSGDDGDDSLSGNLGEDSLQGGGGNDSLYGGQGADALNGGDGADRLSGDLGNDLLTGGAGADRFVFAKGGGQDWVLDFNFAEGDRIQLAPGTAYTTFNHFGDVVISLGNGDQIAISGGSFAAFTADWIVFA